MKPQFLVPFVIVILLFAGLFFIPWRLVSWGNVSIKPSKTITVQGMAKTQMTNQIATFTAGVNAVKDNRDQAIEEVNGKIAAMMEVLKQASIPEEDVKTQNMNIYQNEESYYEDGRQKTRLGQWRVSNTLELKIRDTANVDNISNLLTQAGANNVWGPNFSLDNTEDQEKELLQQAVDNAKEKAIDIALTNGHMVGQLLTITEGSVTGVYPFAMKEMGGGGGGAEPGTGTVQKYVTVTFELR